VEIVENIFNSLPSKAFRLHPPVENLWINRPSFPQAVERKKVFHRDSRFSPEFSPEFSTK
jgi:hypothetical protein